VAPKLTDDTTMAEMLTNLSKAASVELDKEKRLHLKQCCINTHNKMNEIWPHKNEGCPPMPRLESSILAHDYMMHNIPALPESGEHALQYVIIAESHASTHPSLLGASMMDGVDEHYGLPLNDAHLGHLSVVTSMTYGEPMLLDQEKLKQAPENVVRSAGLGTPLFMKGLGVLNGDFDAYTPQGAADPIDPLSDKTMYDNHVLTVLGKSGKGYDKTKERLGKKLNMLNGLRQKGRALIDMSPVAFYPGPGNTVTRMRKDGKGTYTDKLFKIPADVQKQLVNIAFEQYASHLIAYLRPQNVVILGVTLEDAITRDRVKNIVESNGGQYLGAIHHLSYQKKGVTQRECLLNLRNLLFSSPSVNLPMGLVNEADTREQTPSDSSAAEDDWMANMSFSFAASSLGEAASYSFMSELDEQDGKAIDNFVDSLDP